MAIYKIQPGDPIPDRNLNPSEKNYFEEEDTDPMFEDHVNDLLDHWNNLNN